MDNDKIEEVAKAFHDIYFGHFWDSVQGEGRVTRELYSSRDSWENFGEGHKEALRTTIKELIDSGMIHIGG